MIITAGDTVAHHEATGIAVEVPGCPGQFMAAFNAFKYVLIFNENGDDAYDGSNLVERMDPALAVWETLDHDLRCILVGNTNKIAAIKYLRSVTGLGLSDSKRAVETFEA